MVKEVACVQDDCIFPQCYARTNGQVQRAATEMLGLARYKRPRLAHCKELESAMFCDRDSCVQAQNAYRVSECERERVREREREDL